MATSWAELFPPPPAWTEANMPSQSGRVFLITGGSSGIGYEVAKTLYHLNGCVYLTSRTAASAQSAITRIQASFPHPSQTVKSGSGSLEYLVVNLSNLRGIKASAETFLSKEKRLDVVWHNAGTMLPDDPDEMTAQGYNQQLGINALAPFLLQQFLTPLLLHTASLPSTPQNSTRVIFVSSSGHRAAPPGCVAWGDLNLTQKKKTGMGREIERYGQSKAMNCMQAYEFARRYHDHGFGIVSLSLHPGGLSTGLQRNAPGWCKVFVWNAGKEPRFGALTELWAGLGGLGKGEEQMWGE